MIQTPAVLPDLSHGLFFIGIGGVSMSALAMIAKSRGYKVGGSDRADSATVQMLRDAGIPVSIGHRAENLDGYDTVIYNAAIHADNPEYAAGQRLGLRFIYRTDFLAALMGNYPNAIGVAGMHGKSTASAMLSHLFLQAGRDPSVLIGAELPELDRAFRIGHSGDFVFEACEYRDSFLSLRPTIAVVLNVEMDHPDYFKSLEQIIGSFRRYLSLPGPGGTAVVNADSDDAMRAAEDCGTPVITYGIRQPADFTATNLSAGGGFPAFDIMHDGVFFCRVKLSVPGRHNVSNALACCTAAYLCGLSGAEIARGLSSFPGARRRMEYKGTVPGTTVPVFDDFGHHPTEVRATLEGAAELGYARIFCVYQPHTYSRTRELFDAFTTAFEAAHETVFVDIYPARETDTLGMSSELLASRTERSLYLPDYDAVKQYLSEKVQPGDAVVIMGAGDISRFANEIVEA